MWNMGDVVVVGNIDINDCTNTKEALKPLYIYTYEFAFQACRILHHTYAPNVILNVVECVCIEKIFPIYKRGKNSKNGCCRWIVVVKTCHTEVCPSEISKTLTFCNIYGKEANRKLRGTNSSVTHHLFFSSSALLQVQR